MDDVSFVLTSGIAAIFGGLFIVLILSPSSWSFFGNETDPAAGE
ncbi:hypothetical protein [Asticcacaulis sp. AC460]|nr:hypothetical protein [Asticcacaulis sp. AC460]